MRPSSTFLTLLSIATVAHALPMENLDSPLSARAVVKRMDDGKWDENKYNSGGNAAQAPAVKEAAWAAPSDGQASSTGTSSAEVLPVDKALDSKPAASSTAPEVASGAPAAATPDATTGGDSGSSPPATDITSTGSGVAGSGEYKLYTGDGSTWPKMSEWVGSFEAMFASNEGIMSSSCAQFGTANNSPEEITQIKSAIQAKAKSSGLDPRFILAIVMQESKGCVRAPTTNGGVVNPGLMQTHNGVGCTANPCPQSTIDQMIADGATGTADGDGLQQCLAKAKTQGGVDASAYYIAARIYNTGSYVGSDLSKPVVGTACYSSDVANRLTGWTGSGGEACHLTIGGA